MAAVFIPANPEATLYDLIVDGRAREYDIDPEPEDFRAALRRARITEQAYVEDLTGHRTRL